MIEAGTYVAKVASKVISLTKKGDPQVVVTFNIKDKGSVTYFGYFSDKALPYTIKNLITLGLKGNNPAGEIEIGKEVELVVDFETYEGKDRLKVKYINSLDASKNVKAIPQDMALAKLAALEGAVVAARLKLDTNEDLPF